MSGHRVVRQDTSIAAGVVPAGNGPQRMNQSA